ncbi:MAG: chorismate-binding protein, partial [Muribaculaceae bacterium]|nr:chorismate-binding protein [Muribaculaceae bacterium]
VPFFAYVKPEESVSKVHFMAELPGRQSISDIKFLINFWNEPFETCVVIRDTISVADFLEDLPESPLDSPTDVLPYTSSTPQLLHKGQVMSIVDDLKNSEDVLPGKTVLSRIECGSITDEDMTAIWLEVIYNYFKELPGTFRYVYYTPDTACWLGATPELLLDVDKNSGDSHTMSLAGTCDLTRSWDEKNNSEHDLVTLYIMKTLNEFDIKFTHSSAADVKFAFSKHLCDIFDFNIGDIKIPQLLNALSPTPALAGMPVQESIERISHLELHQRYCYGGYVALDSPEYFSAYVNIRCMHFYNNHYCVYAGGGIMKESKPESEWNETTKKSEMLRCMLSVAKCLLTSSESKESKK